MRIAIIGAGFSGLATAWYLLNVSPLFHHLQLTLFDMQEIGEGTSGIAAGLLHPYAGAHAKLNREGQEGKKASLELLQVASNFLGQPVFIESGILRLALSEQQKEDFFRCAQKHPEDVSWLEIEECQEKYPYLAPAPGLWIPGGITVYAKPYLKGLWQACASQGAIFEKRLLLTLQELDNFDEVILAGGALSRSFSECASFPLSVVKGQMLELAWPERLPPLPCPINSQAYLLMGESGRTCLVGSTFERSYTDLKPDQALASEKILPSLAAMIPVLSSATVLSCYAGARAVTRDHFPLVQKIGKNQWIITGMGSKGLLYHALMAKRLVLDLVNNVVYG